MVLRPNLEVSPPDSSHFPVPLERIRTLTPSVGLICTAFETSRIFFRSDISSLTITGFLPILEDLMTHSRYQRSLTPLHTRSAPGCIFRVRAAASSALVPTSNPYSYR